jgi:hypothetical protein
MTFHDFSWSDGISWNFHKHFLKLRLMKFHEISWTFMEFHEQLSWNFAWNSVKFHEMSWTFEKNTFMKKIIHKSLWNFMKFYKISRGSWNFINNFIKSHEYFFHKISWNCSWDFIKFHEISWNISSLHGIIFARDSCQIVTADCRQATQRLNLIWRHLGIFFTTTHIHTHLTPTICYRQQFRFSSDFDQKSTKHVREP